MPIKIGENEKIFIICKNFKVFSLPIKTGSVFNFLFLSLFISLISKKIVFVSNRKKINKKNKIKKN